MPTAPGSFENRRSLPAEWGGLRSDELAAATGVDDAVFAHVAGFYASAGSRDGITALAKLAMALAARGQRTERRNSSAQATATITARKNRPEPMTPAIARTSATTATTAAPPPTATSEKARDSR